jgi:hypothetical protein
MRTALSADNFRMVEPYIYQHEKFVRVHFEFEKGNISKGVCVFQQEDESKKKRKVMSLSLSLSLSTLLTNLGSNDSGVFGSLHLELCNYIV